MEAQGCRAMGCIPDEARAVLRARVPDYHSLGLID